MVMNVWMYGCVMTYIVLMYVIYHAYASKILQKIKGKDMYLHYHIIDTGRYGDMVFRQGTNIVDGVRRLYDRECIKNGTLFFESRNAEPVKVAPDISKYVYFCDTKNFDTVVRNDILQTLMVLRAKDMIIIFLIVIAALVLLAACANVYFIFNAQNEIIKTVTAMNMTSGGFQVIP